jgi:hypothetical protein
MSIYATHHISKLKKYTSRPNFWSLLRKIGFYNTLILKESLVSGRLTTYFMSDICFYCTVVETFISCYSGEYSSTYSIV